MMKLLVIPAAFAATAVSAESVAEAGKVFVLTDKNQEEFFKANSASLVKFYAPWCGHCKQMAPAYEEAAEKLGKEESKIILAKMDATVEKEFPEKHEVRGYPTIKFFVDGASMEFDGPRDAQGIVDWVKKMSGPAVVEGAADAEAPFSVTLFGEEASEVYESFAKGNRKTAAFHFEKASTVKLVFKHKGEDAITVSGDVTGKEMLETLLKKNQFPLFGALDGNTFGAYVDSGVGLLWALFSMTESNAKEVAEEKREMMSAASKELEGVNVTWTNTHEFGRVLENMFGVKDFPKLIFQAKAGDRKKFVYDGEITTDNVIDFVKKCQSGEIEAELKSEAVPEEAKAGSVRKIVGKTMKSMLFSEKKDVLLKVHAPWCGHCKSMAPDYEKVAAQANKKGLEDVLMLAKLDGTENDSAVDSLEWDGFPTLWYFKAGEKTPIAYDGGRDAAGMWSFIKENHSDKERIAKATKELENEAAEEGAEATKELDDMDEDAEL